MIIGMNHAVLYVRDARRHQALLRRRARVRDRHRRPDGQFVFMRAPRVGEPSRHRLLHDRRRSAAPSPAGRSTVGMYHIAWEVADARRARDDAANGSPPPVRCVGASDHGANKSLYAHDPDGLEFEVMWLVPSRQVGRRGARSDRATARPRRRLARFGGERVRERPDDGRITGSTSSTATSSTTPRSPRPTATASGAA